VAHLQHDKDLLQGKNLPESYTAEVLKIAFTNHWHFGHKAVRFVGRPPLCCERVTGDLKRPTHVAVIMIPCHCCVRAVASARHPSILALCLCACDRRWYVAMHRQALLLVQKAAVEFAVNNKPEAAEAFFNAALHYEAHGCHSLTGAFIAPTSRPAARTDTPKTFTDGGVVWCGVV
jgi:hypothetical protein